MIGVTRKWRERPRTDKYKMQKCQHLPSGSRTLDRYLCQNNLVCLFLCLIFYIIILFENKKIVEVSEMKTQTRTIRKAHCERVGNENRRELCNITGIWAACVMERQRIWNEHILRMDQNTLSKILRDSYIPRKN